jgi:hypothetical protein
MDIQNFAPPVYTGKIQKSNTEVPDDEGDIFYTPLEEFPETTAKTDLPLSPNPFTVEPEEEEPSFGFTDFLKCLISPMGRDQETDEATNESLDELGIQIQHAASSAANAAQTTGKFVFNAMKNPKIRSYVIYTVASTAGNYLVAAPATEALLEKLGPLALPITAAALYGLSYTSFPDKIADRIGISKESLVLGGAALAALSTATFGVTCLENLPRIAATAAATTTWQTIVAHATVEPNTHMEDQMETFGVDNAILAVAEAIMPGPVTAAVLGYTALYGKTVVDITQQINDFRESLKTGDMADIAQSLAIGSMENPSTIMSLALHQVGRFTRAGIRSFSDYMNIAAESSKIRGAQEHFTKTYLDPESTNEQKTEAKTHLIATIKNEVRSQCTLSQRLAVAAVNQFNSSFDAALDAVDLSILTRDENKQDYTKELLNIHIRCLVAFSAVNVTDNTPLTQKEQANFISNVAGVIVNHYETINPNSVLAQTLTAVAPRVTQAVTDFLLPDSVATETTETNPVKHENMRELASPSLMGLAISFMMNFFTALLEYFGTTFANTLKEEEERRILNSVLISDLETLSFSENVETASNNPSSIDFIDEALDVAEELEEEDNDNDLFLDALSEFPSDEDEAIEISIKDEPSMDIPEDEGFDETLQYLSSTPLIM